MKLNDETILIAGLAGVGLFLLVYIGRNAKTAGEVVGSAAVDLANGVITGTVTAAGDIVGIPKTNQTECEKAKAEGRTWDASFACPAGDFLSYWWKK
jgi:hypothetical protein